MSSDQQMRAVVERIERLVGEFARSPDPAIRENARELVSLVMRLYGAGLGRILQILDLHEGKSGRIREALLGDDLVASLLVLHDLHPEDVDVRIGRGLARLEEPVGAKITLLEVREGRARVMVRDERHSAPLVDLRQLIESVIRAVAPDIAQVDVEGLPVNDPVPLVQLRRTPLMDGSVGLPVR